MLSSTTFSSNFVHLQAYDEQLVRLGTLAEKYLVDDPNTCLLKLRQFGELMTQIAAAKMGIYKMAGESAYDLQRHLRDDNILSKDSYLLFGEIRRAGNEANHDFYADPQKALNVLKTAWQLGIWFEKTFGKADFAPAPFINPFEPAGEGLNWEEYPHLVRESSGGEYGEKSVIEQLEHEVEQAQVDIERRLQVQQQKAQKKQAGTFNKYRTAAKQAGQNLYLDEAQTRQIIDGQLREAGWEADTVNLRYNKGTRPERGRNLAIAEYPTASGPADYVLFSGLMPIAVVEAKRKNIDVSAALQQAKRYSRDIAFQAGMLSPGGVWDQYQVPFAFSTNARPRFAQLETQSGIWFVDLRRSTNLSHALDGWYTPEGLITLLKRDEAQANKQLVAEPMEFGFPLRYYQRDAIRAVESQIAKGERKMLIAMATGTGKTKTCIALIYRLLKVKRFKRILFLVDREALGEQAANAFKDTRMDAIRSFADIFGVMELDEKTPESETAVQIATVQGMVARLLYPSEHAVLPTVDQYDCIVVDECHRGYLLDREMSDKEITYRNFEDYVSKYRRVIDYFDAVKIGLTATPAAHTSEIFGKPVYYYSYRDAVIDGYLIDHEPPILIKTKLSQQGIQWKAGEDVKLYYPRRNELEIFKAPDEIKLNVEDFNGKVITKQFNQVVCEQLARELDPLSREKTLIFCANNTHADLVVDLLKKAFEKQYGDVDDDAIVKITGSADQPLQLIRRYKNERNPNIAVTVDLLTTGIDVPEICNLAFLRSVNSRILFDQMLGRATRLCEEIGKEKFRVFDAIGIYSALEKLTAMKPVVVDPKISFSQLVDEIIYVKDEAERELIRDQLMAKFQGKKRHMSEASIKDFETIAGVSPEAFIKAIKNMPIDEMAKWFTDNRRLGEILDRHEGAQKPMLVSEHPDEFVSAEHGYGDGKKPQDYLEEFKAFIQTNRDIIPALITVLTRPRELTRKHLRELAMELERAGFSETKVTTAWRDMTNQEIAAHIIGFIRHIATGDPLVPYERRVDWAFDQMLKAREWSAPQRQWLQRIAAQTKANIVVDRDALNDPDLIFTREGGGYARLDRMFDGQLANTLETFNDLLWNKDNA